MKLYKNLKIKGQVPIDLAANFDFSIQADQIEVNFRPFQKKKSQYFFEILEELEHAVISVLHRSKQFNF